MLCMFCACACTYIYAALHTYIWLCACTCVVWVVNFHNINSVFKKSNLLFAYYEMHHRNISALCTVFLIRHYLCHHLKSYIYMFKNDLALLINNLTAQNTQQKELWNTKDSVMSNKC